MQDSACGLGVENTVVHSVVVARTSLSPALFRGFSSCFRTTKILLILSAFCKTFNKRDRFATGAGRAGTG